MVRALAAAGCAFLLAACDAPLATPVASPTPSNNTAESPAATLRVQLELLFGEHIFTVAKLAVAASAGRQDEYRSYAGLLAQNGGDLEALLRMAGGETAGGQFGAAWTQQNDYLVNLIVATATRDQAAAGTAGQNLNTRSAPQLAGVLTSALSVDGGQAGDLLTQYEYTLQSIVSAAAGTDQRQLFQIVNAAGGNAATFAGAVTKAVVHEFPDRFPGDPAATEAEHRVTVNQLAQQQGYLMTMATDAAAAGIDVTGILAVLVAAADRLSPLLGGGVWRDEAPLVTTYAKSGRDPDRAAVLSAAAAANLTDVFSAVLKVVDDQRNKQFGNVATDDRAMAAQLSLAADAPAASSSS